MVAITLRSNLSRALTHEEVDNNFSNLENAVDGCVNIAKGLTWAAGTYKLGSMVLYNDATYVAIVNETANLPTVVTDWSPVGTSKTPTLATFYWNNDELIVNHFDPLIVPSIVDGEFIMVYNG